MTLKIKIVKKPKLENNTIPSNGDIGQTPNSVVLVPNSHLEPANNDVPKDEKAPAQSEKPQSDEAYVPSASDLDGSPNLADEVLLADF